MSIQQATIKFSEFKNTSTGPIAKIDGKWWSVNGTHQDIVDVRYALNSRELQREGIKNDGLDDLKTEMVNKDRELRMIDTALTALRELYVHALNTGVAYTVLEDMMSSDQHLVDRAQQVRNYVAAQRATYNI